MIIPWDYHNRSARKTGHVLTSNVEGATRVGNQTLLLSPTAIQFAEALTAAKMQLSPQSMTCSVSVGIRVRDHRSRSMET